MSYWYKKKYAITDENHVIFNFRLKKYMLLKSIKEKEKKYGSMLKYQQVKKYRFKKAFRFGIGIKHKYMYI